MKKLLFSAFAVMAFAGSSFAGNVENKKNVDCVFVAIDFLEAVDPDYNLNQEQVNFIFQLAYHTCLKYNN
ncbi:hypothetical protein GV828_05025 [Flavobacterium sp. NST-5]|uniref:Uncharacterized protein n=1 Tax=Flavobacterium ichthyis TaxID=2698827 RepID=A0ABW9Z786_9FLAO|nr:hypothetical protein [Flavobacterium ichthyis]NBL64561.1 hypothetical protein [Flavobacterium ichthyis]